MSIDEAIKILEIVKCDNMGYCRDLSYTPQPEEIGEAIEILLTNNRQMAECIRSMKAQIGEMVNHPIIR